MPEVIPTTSTNEPTFPIERDHSACGVGMMVNLPRTSTEGVVVERTNQQVLDGLRVLGDFEYRSGLNPATGESDGAGIRIYPLPTAFFNKKIAAGECYSPSGDMLADLNLEESRFAIGQYFFNDPTKIVDAKSAVEEHALANKLRVVGWRELIASVCLDELSEVAREKKPAMWQAILLPLSEDDLEGLVLKMSLTLSHQIQKEKIPMNIVSQSSESIVYKGMIPAKKMGAVYLDLLDKDFTAIATAVHARFATNTDPQWANAQPCPFEWLHNGELNSAPLNASEMRYELLDQEFKGVFPDKTLSDSMQFDADLLNQMVMRGISLAEAFVRLMPPPRSDSYSEEINAMLTCFRKERTPYNGPTFAVARSAGFTVIKSDECGLRPSRWGIIQYADGRRQFHAGSDDYLQAPEGAVIIHKGELEPGGMMMVTPEGDILDTGAILERISKGYQHAGHDDYFRSLHKATALTLATGRAESSHSSGAPLPQRLLFASGWDDESITQVLKPMAERGLEATGAMGDDTNALHSMSILARLSAFFHKLFAQVSSPALDSKKERYLFSLKTILGPMPGLSRKAPHIELDSPILRTHEFDEISLHPHAMLDTSFAIPASGVGLNTASAAELMREAIKQLLFAAKKLVSEGASIIILSDRNISPGRAVIPDLIAVAAVRKHLEECNLIRRVSIVADSYQIAGPHEAATLLAVGAKAVYPRAAYLKIREIYEGDDPDTKEFNYYNAQKECLLKTMGMMGLTDVNNYINGHFIAPLGLDLAEGTELLADHPTLANIFSGMYSPLRGWNLGHIARALLERHYIAYDPEQDFTLMPRSGFFMPEKGGIKHGYGPAVTNAFTDWLKAEELRFKLWRLDTILEGRGCPALVSDRSIFTPAQGFLDPTIKDAGTPKGTYPVDYLELFKVSPAFRVMTSAIDQYKRKNPTTLRDHLSVKKLSPFLVRRAIGLPDAVPSTLQTQASIRAQIFSGSMSQGALTVGDPDTPDKRAAHETLTLGVNAVHANSASGEGGESPKDLRNPLSSTRSKQIASGRFGVSAMQILCAKEIEIKVAQGAKPGEGGELPGLKVGIRFAAQRGGLPGTPFISPPPHHDIYSIEDLEQLIHDIKTVNPGVSVAVKLVASQGIGTIAIGVAKAGADVINIASNSGGTAAAQQSSIKHSGLPSELGLAEVDRALRKTKLRDLVQLRTSGGFKTADDIILAAILGADQFELGTTAMLTLGCKMQRTCDKSCQPGVATDGHLFNGNQLNTERYIVNLSAAIQERLEELGVPDLQALRGHTELLELIDPEIAERFDFSPLLDRTGLPPLLTPAELTAAKEKRRLRFSHEKEDALIAEIKDLFAANKSAVFISPTIALTTEDRSFGARIAGVFAEHLEANPRAKIILNTTGIAGQSYGFVMPGGMAMQHIGSVQDGCGKSMTDGELIVQTPNQSKLYRADENTISGNAMLYGASGGKAFIEGVAGHRFGILLKGAQVVVEGAGDLAFEYMTSGTGMILGKVGQGLCTGSSGGIVFVYDKGTPAKASVAVGAASPEARRVYEGAIRCMLEEHVKKTNSIKAQEILATFDISQFSVWIPTELDKIKTFKDVLNVIKTYQLRQSLLTVGMQVWFEQRTIQLVSEASTEELPQWRTLLTHEGFALFSGPVRTQLIAMVNRARAEDFGIPLASVLVRAAPAAPAPALSPDSGVQIHPRIKRPVEARLGDITGVLDEELLDAFKHINAYVAELTHDATGCSGCRAQSCAGGDDKVETGCPSGKAINTINSILKQVGPIPANGVLTPRQMATLRQAFELQIKESPFIAYTGAACPAPCQDACTETIPGAGPADPKRGGKPVGEYVHIKDIEYSLFQIGRSLGWLKEAFAKPLPARMKPEKELIIVGSGPAAMQIAFEALRDGVTVKMYEKSDKPGGLLRDGIPHHKFSKTYLDEDFANLVEMGLKLHLKSEIVYDERSGTYQVNGIPVATIDNENQCVVVCAGAGLPTEFKADVTSGLGVEDKKKIIQAVDFLKIANDVSDYLNKHPDITAEDRERLIKDRFAHMDPRGKKIVVVGGGDTAQDVIRWVARYFNDVADPSENELNILVRGPELVDRAVSDAYPAPSRAPTKENALRAEEVEYVRGQNSHLVEPRRISVNEAGKLTVHVRQSEFKYHDAIQSDPQLKQLSDALPREQRPLDPTKVTEKQIENVDLVICALGFQGKCSIPLVQAIEKAVLSRVFIAGDASSAAPKIIVGAQANAKDTYEGQIMPSLGIGRKSVSALVHHTIFNKERAAAAGAGAGAHAITAAVM